MKHKTVCIVGLGYVGLPLANAFSKHLKVIGYDIEGEKVKRLNKKDNNTKANIEFTTDHSKIEHADFVIIAVPTPVTKSKEPDLRYVKLFCKQKPLLKKCLRYFCKQKPLLKIAYAIFCFAKRNISLVKLSFLKKGLL
jgi:UDP-N-acetyl-D-mannosaminuronate dehydrogenase